MIGKSVSPADVSIILFVRPPNTDWSELATRVTATLLVADTVARTPVLMILTDFVETFDFYWLADRIIRCSRLERNYVRYLVGQWAHACALSTASFPIVTTKFSDPVNVSDDIIEQDECEQQATDIDTSVLDSIYS